MAGATSTRETTTALAAEHETEPNLDVLTQAVALIAVSIAERSLQPEQLPEKCNIDVCKLGKLEKNRDAGSSHKRKASPQKKASPSRSLALALQDPDKLDGYRPKRLQEALVGNHGGSPFSGTQDATSSGHVGGPTKPACVKGGREKACAFDHAEGEDPYQVLDEDPYLGRRVDKGGLLGTIVECTRLYVVRYNDGSEDHIELPEQDAEESRKVEGIVRTVSHCSSVEEEEIASLKAQVEQLQGALRSSSQRSAVEEGALRSSSQRSAVEEVEQEKSPSFFRRVLSRITSWTPRRRRPSRLEDADLDSIERTPKRRDLRPSDTDLDACDPSPKLQRRLRPSDEDTDIHASDRSPKLRRLLQPSGEEIVRPEAPAEWTEELAVKPKARPTTPRRFNSQKRQPCARQSGVRGVIFDKNKTCWVACFSQGGELLTGRFRYTKYLHLVGGKEDAAIQMAMKDAISFRQRGPASGVGGYSGLPVVPGGKPHLAIEDVRPSGSGKSGDKHGASDGVPARRSSAVAKRSLVLKRKRPNLKVKVKRKPLKATDSKSVQQKDNAGKVKVWSAKPKVAWAKRRVSSTGKAPPAKRAARIVVKRTTGFRTKLPVKKVRKGSKRKSGVKGVQWDSRRLTWRPYIQYEGKMLRGPSVRPKDQSEEQVEKARVIAMKNRDTLERSFKGSIRRT
eukprot:TRINITY_DN14395_c0_g1_i2.p1 TRINITY_DN14395_c0_g1~~TRINITY_DN14395_c0_g1_i2.p1  ORF type:complete len:689 (+),score=124.14 TRINITY_DN14395_c0_g1_i2:31-2067(+)